MTTNNAINSTSGGNFVGRNRLINGDMQVWQRGAGGSAAIAVAASTTLYTVDRWQLATGANQACTVTQTAGATSGSYLAAVQRNSGQTGTTALAFCSSLTRDMSIGAAGNLITISFKAQSGANFSPTSGNITVTVYSGTGTTDISGINGAFTGSTAVISQTQAITSTLTNYAFTSAAIGSGVTQLAVQFSWTPTGTAGVADTVLFTDVQLEIGPSQTPFDRKPFVDTLQQCQGFFDKSFQYSTAPGQNVSISGVVGYVVQIASTVAGYGLMLYHPRSMRANPTTTFYNPGATNANFRNLTTNADSGAVTPQTQNAHYLFISNPQAAGDAVGNLIGIQYSSDSEIT